MITLLSHYTPGKNKLFRKNEFWTNGRLHENPGVKSFSQLRDERILSSSKQEQSYTGPAKPPNLPIFGRFGGLAGPV